MKYFNRGNQYWSKKNNGEILLINLPEKNHHYNGDGHIFLKTTDSFDQSHAKKITRDRWLEVRDAHIDRLKKF